MINKSLDGDSFSFTSNYFLLSSDDSFIIHRKLLRRRHVRKEQMRRQREAAKQRRNQVGRKLSAQHLATIPSGETNSLPVDVIISMASPCHAGHIHIEQSTVRVDSCNMHNIDTIHTSSLLSMPFPFSPMRSKRRKLNI
jgi:hypothetical protein